MSLSGFTRRLLISFVAEKQEKKQEYLLTLGLSKAGYVSGWMLHYYLLGLLASLLLMVGVFLSRPCHQALAVLLSQTLFSLAITNQAFCISTLFNNPKQAGELGSLI